MPEISDSQYWQEQEQRANEIRPILERTFALAQQYGWVEPISDECWQYQGDKHTLVYDPESDALWIEANDSNWCVNFHEQAFVPEPDTQITEEQLQDFQALRDYLEQQDVVGDVDLRAVQQQAQQQWNQDHIVTEDDRGSIANAVEQLFEYYASQGEVAYKLSPESTEHLYRLAVEDKIYVVSRDDAAGSYHLQQEGANLDLSTGQSVTQADIKTWAEIDTWVAECQRLEDEAAQASKNGWEETYWSQQENRANVLLAIAEQVFSYQESQGGVRLDESQQNHVTNGLGDYQVGYNSTTDTLWMQRGDTVMVSAINHHQHYDLNAGRWQLEGLNELGAINLDDIAYFQSLQAWLQAKESLTEREPGIIGQTRMDLAIVQTQVPIVSSRLENNNPLLTEIPPEVETSGVEVVNEQQTALFEIEDNLPIDYEERE
ncbi:hypothetical protein JOY44_25705 (plasmid) [Phormidium sp. CLA17]|uniref:hypothetical protein n=1 Tax=Leptolyngbya sp. Cla-17 TaxID=2803751 RepID=UPI001492D295|nr:hypothetical protein [Leptolyngbya sp. Cla-17]MBM0744918.1 hypothetical protein [Leptolyngbya sp. Cla-17]